MKSGCVKWIFFFMLVLALIFTVKAGAKSPQVTTKMLPEYEHSRGTISAKEHQILNATLQINIFASISQEELSADAAHDEAKLLANSRAIARGQGSLVHSGGDAFILTHNHWGSMLSDLSLIEFRDAEGVLLVRLFGFEFQELIRYQDAGTMVLQAPQALISASRSLTPANLNTNPIPEEGEKVMVSTHASGGGEKVRFLEVEVISTGQYKGLPVFVLRSLDGEVVVQGDSGGGVWYQGKLIGNLWATIVKDGAADRESQVSSVTETDATVTEFSYAAALPTHGLQHLHETSNSIEKETPMESKAERTAPEDSIRMLSLGPE